MLVGNFLCNFDAAFAVVLDGSTNDTFEAVQVHPVAGQNQYSVPYAGRFYRR